MVDLVDVGFRVDTGGLERANRELDRMGRKGPQVSQTTQRTARGFDLVTKSANVAAQAIASIGAALAAREIIRMADAYNQAQRLIDQFTGSQEKTNKVLGDLFSLAQQNRQGLEATVSVYQRFRIATQEIGLSSEELLSTISGLQKAVVLSGVSADEARSGMIQLAQGMASGRVQGEELRAVLESMPTVARAIAEEAGIAFGDLRDAAAEGKIGVEQVVGALQALNQNLDISSTSLTISEAFTLVNNSLLRFVGLLDDSAGASGLVASAIASISTALDFLSDNIDTVEALALGLAAAFATVLAPAILRAVTAMRLFNVALLTNPLTAIPAAVGLAVAALHYYRDSVVEIGDTTATVGDILEAVFVTARQNILLLTYPIRSLVDHILEIVDAVDALASGDIAQIFNNDIAVVMYDVSTALGDMADSVVMVAEFFAELASALADLALEELLSVVDEISEYFSHLGDEIDFLTDEYEKLTNSVLEFVDSNLLQYVKDLIPEFDTFGGILDDIAEVWSIVTKAALDMVDSLQSGFVEFVERKFPELVQTIQPVIDAWRSLGSTASESANQVEQAAQASVGGSGGLTRSSLPEEVQKVVDSLEEEIQVLDAQRVALTLSGDAALEHAINVRTAQEAIEAGIPVTGTMTAAQKDQLRTIKELVRELYNFQDAYQFETAQQDLQQEIERNRLILQFRGQETDELRVQLRLLEIKNELGEDAARDLEDQIRQVEAQTTKIDAQREAYREQQQVIEDISATLSDSFIEAFEDSEKGFQGLIDSMEAGIKRFAAQLLQEQFVMPIVAQVVGGLGFGGASGTAGGAAGNAALGAVGGTAGAGIGATIGAAAPAVLGSSGAFGGLGNAVGLASAAGALLSGASFTGGSSFVGSAFSDVGASLFGGAVEAGTGQVANATFGNAGLSFSSPAGILGGVAGSIGGGFASDALGIEQNLGGTIGGTIGSIAGSFIPVPFVGTAIGSFAGTVLGNLIGSLFGGGSRPSTDYPGGQAELSFTPGIGFNIGGTASAFGGSPANSRATLESVGTALNRLQDDLGFELIAGFHQTVAQAFEGGTEGSGLAPFRGFVNVTNELQRFTGSPEEIVQQQVAAIISGTVAENARVRSAAPEAFQEAVRGVSDPTDIEEVAAAIDSFVNQQEALRVALDDAANGVFDLRTELERAADQFGDETLARVQSLREEAERFGLDAAETATNLREAVRRLVDQEAAAEPEMTAFEAELELMRLRFEALVPVLEDVGLSADLAATGLAQAESQLREEFNERIQDEILSITNPLQLALENLEEAQQQRLDNAAAIGADIVSIERLNALERQRVIEQQGDAAVNSLQETLQQLRYGDLGGASPTTTLAAARASFEAAAGQAAAGDFIARGRLGDLATQLVESSRAVNATGGGFASDVQRAIQVLERFSDLPGFANGGSFTVPGSGQPDSSLFAARVSPGERIDFSPANRSNDRDDVMRAMVRELSLSRQANEETNRRLASLQEDNAQLRRQLTRLIAGKAA